MATTIEELRAVMRMELKPFIRDVQQMNGINTRAAKQVEQTWLQTNRRLDGIGRNMAQSLTAPLTGIGAALGVRELIRLTDTWTDLNGRIRIAAGGMREGADVMSRLSDMARRTYSSLETTAESYLTNSRALKELGYNTTQQLDFTEALNNALVVSGAKGQRATQVIDALGKAMALGQLRGDELNTVIQSGGRIAQALADGLGVTTNELRKMGEQGKLKSSSVFTALTSQMQTLRDEADGMQATIGDALQLLNNSFLEYVGGADQAAGASARIAESIILVADNMDTVASAALLAAQAIIGALAGRAMVGAGVQILTTAKALAEFVRIARAAQGLGGLGPAFASLGAQAGVIGLVVGGAAALALGHFANQAVEAKVRSEYVNAELERMGLVARDAADGLNEADEALNDLTTAKGIADAKQRTEQFAQEVLRVNREFSDLTKSIEQVAETSKNLAGEQTEGAAGYAQAVARVTQAFKAEEMAAKDVADALNEIARTFPDYAIEKARAQAELENAATKAGIALGPERRAEIEQLSEGYARATVEAAKLAEAQGASVAQMESLRDASREALETIIDGFLEGKSAGEIFLDVLGSIGKQLMTMGMNNLFGTGQGANPFGWLGKIFGFADGGIAAHGKPQPLSKFAKGGISNTAAIFGEAGPEAAVPLPDGRRIPVDLRIPSPPSIPVAPAMSPTVSMPVVINAPGADAAGLERVAEKLDALKAAVPTMAKKAFQEMRKYGQVK